MALFGRRCLQRVLTENVVFLGPKEAENKCNLLNTYDDPHYLSTEWELAVLNAASKVGTVEYEKRMRTHQPDLLFKSSDPPLEFLADITTLSDGGLRERNPVHALQSEFWRHLSKRRLFEGGGFDVQIDPYSLSFYRGSKEKPRLKLPRQSEWPTKIFNSGFRAFLEKVSNNPEQNQRFDVIAADTGVHFEYDPTRRGMATLNHLSFEIANVIDQNTIYKALKTKAAQLKATGYKGVTGVFLCDGDCNVLRSTTGSFAAYSPNEIVREFLRKSHSVTFVVRLVVRESNSQVLIEVKLDFNPKRPIDPGPLTQVISRIHQLLPRPEFTPARALHHLKSGDGKSGRYSRLERGGYVKMSARMLLELLAGVRTASEFEKAYRLKPSENPFRRMFSEGRPISKVTIERQPEEDDDLATIEFGDDPDPAFSQFHV